MIPVAEALERLLGGVEPLESEAVELHSAGNRVLSAPVLAGRTHPPFDASAMDGYAVRAVDVDRVPARLTVIGESAAGRRFAGSLGDGEAVRIFTGAPVPQGADTILIQENAEREGDVVTAIESVAAGRHIRKAGLDFHSGDVLLEAGRRIDPQALALIAAADADRVRVVRRPRVAIIATGDELVQPGASRTDDQIIASNSFGVAQIVRDSGGDAIDLGIVGDDLESIGSALDRAVAETSDVIVTLGGASVGDHDLTAKAFAAKGVDLAFWKIAMRPGKPLMAGRLGRASVLGLPGNPVSAMVCADLFLRPLLAALQGLPTDQHLPKAALDGVLAENDRRQDYVRAIARLDDQGDLIVSPLAMQDSSMLRILARANCLIVRAPYAPAQRSGDPCRILMLRPIV
ncbi:gephyrin-like molybdotransferase Glp [Aliihoeflea sp. 2WW]|uniref:molybdopterin molybdotransferase MoeA n=1 Tax=Aliihoeflea sp. 2WW TaxID=1381123 RepID=UPI0004677751|nr:gephyrin-like molybdotransferase Glp [Aliihoeflea sp. 2WW]